MSQFNEHNMPGPGDPETWPPCTGHPNDPRTPEAYEDSDEYKERKQEIFEERVKDLYGYLTESFTEASTESLTALAHALLCHDQAQIGFVVKSMVHSYCWASIDDSDVEPPEPEPELREEYDDTEEFYHPEGNT